ncbi:TetR/AcrR family transcriptional regulator [Streptacidiphilus fuscans]|uniref:TetR/AcrR family transcriptional regulator n=1 Tax=Streptacidiphilus fuscans TaxID=2789292 RepID=A0A931B8X6_9ACTN|nr:TetR/AcrR family transcriptional regulator [Streptacidiphilus fuscans]MBF9069045.1 TetR/AcrR family transcriptional regulator [Streptacidiphilus fuscans]
MSTETLILLTAERLFATQGIDATSMRQIGQAAGQRNAAATQYHFRNKQLLLKAIFEHRLGAIDLRRRDLLAALQQSGEAADPWRLVEALVRPLAEQAVLPGSHYVRFLERVFEHAGRDVALLAEIGGLDQAVAAGRLVHARLPLLDTPQGRLRLRWAGQLIISGLADLEQRCADAAGSTDPEEFTTGLVDAVTGLVTAPHSH